MHCLAANACEVRFDKKGRPYTVCKCCWTKSFFHSMESLRGVAIAPVLLEQALAERAKNPVYAAWFDEKIAALVKHVSEHTMAPRPVVSAQPLAGPSEVAPFEAAPKAVST
jgi:hypothetical protein